MPAARCEKCGAEFERAPHESWKKLCYPCWREKQENSQVVALRRRLASLEDELDYQENVWTPPTPPLGGARW